STDTQTAQIHTHTHTRTHAHTHAHTYTHTHAHTHTHTHMHTHIRTCTHTHAHTHAHTHTHTLCWHSLSICLNSTVFYTFIPHTQCFVSLSHTHTHTHTHTVTHTHAHLPQRTSAPCEAGGRGGARWCTGSYNQIFLRAGSGTQGTS